MSKQAGSDQELEVTLGLLRAVQNDQKLTQRSAALELGIALGLVNTYLKRCISKGLVKVRQAPNRRYAYYLTPRGFAEKSRLTAEFLSQSLNLFRQAKTDYGDILELCLRKGWHKIALCGAGDLAEVLILLSKDFDVEIVGIIDAACNQDTFADLPVVAEAEHLPAAVDAFLITDLQSPQSTYDALIEKQPYSRVLAPHLLELMLREPASVGGLE